MERVLCSQVGSLKGIAFLLSLFFCVQTGTNGYCLPTSCKKHSSGPGSQKGAVRSSDLPSVGALSL